MNKMYLASIVKHYENCLDEYGDTHKGVDWPKENDANTRYSVMLDIIKFANDSTQKTSLLDFGCGAAHLLEFINKNKFKNIIYSGLDVSDKFVTLCKRKFSNFNFFCIDVLENEIELPVFDYIIMNGVFTEKRELSFDNMWDYFREILVKVFSKSNKGIAFNVMSKAVDWEREDLFHLSIDLLIAFLTKNLTRNFIIRNDYGLYEYTVYAYKRVK